MDDPSSPESDIQRGWNLDHEAKDLHELDINPTRNKFETYIMRTAI